MKIVNKTLLLSLVTICAVCNGLAAHAEVEKNFHLAFDASGSYGPVSGYAQTPLGGVPSSTSNKRPKFNELGIDTAMTVNLSLSASRAPHRIYGAVHLVDLSGGRTLDKTLIFHGKGYPAGSRVKGDIHLNWYEIGYQYEVHLGGERVNLSIAPTVTFALWDFSAELESHGETNGRSYIKATPRVGLETEWFPGNRFSVSGKAIASVPINNAPDIYTFGLAGKYNILNPG